MPYYKQRPANLENLGDAARDLAEREQPVASTAIASVSYNFITNEVGIQFTDGSRYTYHDVDTDTYVGLVRAGSKGQYFNANIRNNFSFTRG